MLMLEHKPNQQTFVDELLPHLLQVEYPECDDFIDIPKHLDDQYISGGFFSTVWKIPGNPFHVLKVSHREEDACRHYVRWVADVPDRHAPTIHSIDYHENLMLIVMDRYYKHPEYYQMGHTLGDVPCSAVLKGVRRPKHDDSAEMYAARIRRNIQGCTFDLHRDNIMVDRDGVLIITDPVSFDLNSQAC